jgi:hypothetical protein
MSRSIKHTTAPGYEYWSRRPTGGCGGTTPGRWAKRLTHRLERLEAKKEIRAELRAEELHRLTCDCLNDYCRGECWFFNIKEDTK